MVAQDSPIFAVGSAVHASPSLSQLRMIGVQMPVTPPQEQTLANLLAVQEALRTGRVDPSRFVPPPTPQAVFADLTGKTYVLVHDELGQMIARPMKAGPQANLADGPSPGSFISRSVLDSVTSAAATAAASNGPCISAIAAGIMARHLAAVTTTNAATPGSTSANTSSGSKAPSATTTSLSTTLLNKLESFAETQGEQAAAKILSNLIIGDTATAGVFDGLSKIGGELGDLSANLGKLGAGIAEFGIGQAIDMAGQEIMSTLFPIDDTSSSLQVLEAQAAKKLMSELQSEAEKAIASLISGKATDTASKGDSLSKQLNDMLGTPAGGIALARTGDETTDLGTVEGGTSKTKVGGVAVARLGDNQVCPVTGPPAHVGGPIMQGNASILIEGFAAAGDTHKAQCTGCGGTTLIVTLAKDVQIGAAGANAPQSPATLASTESDSAGALQSSADAGAPASSPASSADSRSPNSIGNPAVGGGAPASSPPTDSEGMDDSRSTTGADSKAGADSTAGDGSTPGADPTAAGPAPMSREDYLNALRAAGSTNDAINLALQRNNNDTGAAGQDIIDARNADYNDQLAAINDERIAAGEVPLSSADLSVAQVRQITNQNLADADAFFTAAHGSQASGLIAAFLGIDIYENKKYFSTLFGILGPTDDGSDHRQSPYTYDHTEYAILGLVYAEQHGVGFKPDWDKIRSSYINNLKDHPGS